MALLAELKRRSRAEREGDGDGDHRRRGRSDDAVDDHELKASCDRAHRGVLGAVGIVWARRSALQRPPRARRAAARQPAIGRLLVVSRRDRRRRRARQRVASADRARAVACGRSARPCCWPGTAFSCGRARRSARCGRDGRGQQEHVLRRRAYAITRHPIYTGMVHAGRQHPCFAGLGRTCCLYRGSRSSRKLSLEEAPADRGLPPASTRYAAGAATRCPACTGRPGRSRPRADSSRGAGRRLGRPRDSILVP